MRKRWVAAIAAGIILAGAGGASAQMFIYPARGQSPDQQNRDHGECHVWAVQTTGFDPANPGGASAQAPGAVAGGAVRGAARGAAVGSVGGAIGGNAGRGAAIGAATGGLMGGMGRADSRNQATNAQSQGLQSFNRAFATCMQGRGYTVN